MKSTGVKTRNRTVLMWKRGGAYRQEGRNGFNPGQRAIQECLAHGNSRGDVSLGIYNKMLSL